MIHPKNIFSAFQKIGKALMLPVAVLPIAGLLLGIGSAHFAILPVTVSDVMAQAGAVIFGNLPLLFAIATALGLTANDGVSALASVVGYFVLLATLGVFSKMLGYPVKPFLGIESVDTGVFGGILIGAITAWIFNRFYKIELPSYLGFFSGKRSVPILTAFAAIALGLVLSFVWPPVGKIIHSFSEWSVQGNPALAFGLYGFVERLLLPFGLHHIWNVPFFFEAGHYIDPRTGKELVGEVARYIGGDPTAGNLAGGYLFKMWGLPAAAIAIWRSARPEHRAVVGGVMISAALTSFLTGITEPIEFSFLFVAPILYGLHALLCGAAYALCIVLGIKHGMTFSHGLVDFLILFPESKNALWFFVLGPLWAMMYYVVFTFCILKFNLRTPGREIETTVSGDSAQTEDRDQTKAEKLIAAFGNAPNIVSLDSCITRIRVVIKDKTLVNKEALIKLGATAVMMVPGGVQAIFGTNSENLRTSMDERLKRTSSRPKANAVIESIEIAPNSRDVKIKDLAFMKLLGGADNVIKASHVAHSRLRIELKNEEKLDQSLLSGFGVTAVMKIKAHHFHLIFRGAPQI